MTAVIVQCRLSSTRLPGKALMPLEGASLFEWTLRACGMIPADAYIAAVAEPSYGDLLPAAQALGWECFPGPEEDVLGRFCAAIRNYGVDTVVRATADNPFLFFEAAGASLTEFTRLKADYLTYTGLPHGSGVEVMNAQALLRSHPGATPFEKEHVGPALYQHPDTFDCRFIPAPAPWNHPGLRTTVDTARDLRRARRIARALKSARREAQGDAQGAFTAEEICAACASPPVSRPVLLVPSVKKGQGTGHLRRMLELALETGAEVLVPPEGTLAEAPAIVAEALGAGLSPGQVIQSLPEPGEYALVVSDLFRAEAPEAEALSAAGPLVGIDEGSPARDAWDYLLDIIPPLEDDRRVNLFESGFITLPEHRRSPGDPGENAALVVFGGEDPGGLALDAALRVWRAGADVTAVVDDPEAKRALLPPEARDAIRLVPPAGGLRDKLHRYGLVVTHYGLTAWEARHAGCRVLLGPSTPLHGALARKYGFEPLMVPGTCAWHHESRRGMVPGACAWHHLGAFITRLASGVRRPCPVCGTAGGPVAARTEEATFRRCPSCGIQYQAFQAGGGGESYGEDYFFGDYKQHYGRTYLEDFGAIKARGAERMTRIRRYTGARRGAILDVGCAYGPFLAAAADAGWDAYGIDVSERAVAYVRDTLGFPAVPSSLEDFDPEGAFGVREFDAVTLWFVLEHLPDAGAALKKIRSLLKPGGLLAFSTPSASGVSARTNPQGFYGSSPRDHVTLWEPERARPILSSLGFDVLKIVSTGHHPERFPRMERASGDSLAFKALGLWSRVRSLGDTFEAYCVAGISNGGFSSKNQL